MFGQWKLATVCKLGFGNWNFPGYAGVVGETGFEPVTPCL